MQVTLLGTGNPIPDPLRAGPSTLVRAGAATLLVDAGRGVLMRLAGAGAFPPQLTAVLLTHLHSDHITDLNDVITSYWVMNQQPATLTVYGPVGTESVVSGIIAMLGPDISYRIAHHADIDAGPQVEVVEVLPGSELTFGDVTVKVAETNHKPVEPTVGYRVEHDGRSLVLGGDGVPCPTLDELCAGADTYVQTAIREDLVKLVPLQRFVDILDYHSSVTQAAETAAKAGVGKLVLTHQVPAMQPGQEDEWRSIAAAAFDGEIVLGEDGLTIEV
jgi:ribonuclease Z